MAMTFMTSSKERLRIDTNGNVMFSDYRTRHFSFNEKRLDKYHIIVHSSECLNWIQQHSHTNLFYDYEQIPAGCSVELTEDIFVLLTLKWG